MASALQKLFRKRLSKHQHAQEQQQRQQQQSQQKHDETARTQETADYTEDGLRARRRMDTQPYLTVSSLNSPSSSSSYFPYSSKLSLDQFSITSGTDGTYTPAYSHALNESSGSSARNEGSRPRSVSLSAQSMLRDTSDSGREWSSSAYSEEEPKMDQFGVLVANEQRFVGTGEEKEDDLESNFLYKRLSERPELKVCWNTAKLVLIPFNTDDIPVEDLESNSFLALHAMIPSNLFKDQFVSIRTTFNTDRVMSSSDLWSQTSVTATLEAESKTVHLIVNDAPGRDKRIEHKIRVRGETTIYRSMSADELTQSATVRPALKLKRPAMIRRERVRVRVLLVDGPMIPRRFDALVSEDLSTSVRTLNVNSAKEQLASGNSTADQLIQFPQQESTTSWALPSHSTAPPEEGSKVASLPLRRRFIQDLLFMLKPPTELQILEPALHTSLSTLIKASREFTQAYVYVAGFDAYNSSRIRRGILSRAWQAFETYECDATYGICALSSKDQARLIHLMENVVMGYCHEKVYTSIRNVFCTADEIIDTVISTYMQKKVTMDDLNTHLPYLCRRPGLLQGAINAVAPLGELEKSVEDILQQAQFGDLEVSMQNADVLASLSTVVSTETNLRTPLDVLETLQNILEEISGVVDKMARPGESKITIGTDEIIPILAFVLIQADVKGLASLLYYVRQFGISDATSSQKNWALVTHEAVLEYLRKDPLQLCVAELAALRVRPSSRQRDVASPHLGHRLDQSVSLGPVGRERRNSLPSSALLAMVNESEDITEAVLAPKPKYSSSASVFELRCGSGSPSSDFDTAFKKPGVPASLYNERSRSRLSFALTSVGEDGAMADESSVLPAHTYVNNRRTSRRTTSMSGTGDLLIRPQIVVRSHRSQSQRHQHASKELLSSSLGRSLEQRSRMPLAEAISNTSQPVTRTLSLGGKSMARASSQESSIRQPIKENRSSRRATKVSTKQMRRKSLDAWSAFSFFSDQTANAAEVEAAAFVPKSEVTHAISTSPAMQRLSVSPTLSSPSTSWLPSWSHDWGMPIRKDSRRGQGVISPVTTSARSDATDTSDVESRPTSRSSQSHGVPMREWSFPQSSSANSKISSLCPPSPSRSSSKQQLDSDSTTYSDHTTTVSTVDQSRKTPTLSSDTSSSFYSQAYSQASSSHQKEPRKRKGSRVRLLSVSSPAQPLPPKVFSESAVGRQFSAQVARRQGGHSVSSNDHVEGSKFDESGNDSLQSKKRFAPKSNLSNLAALQLYHDQYRDLQSPSDDSTPTLPAPNETTASLDLPSRPRLGRLQLPTPIEERSDPLVHFPVAI